MSDAIAIPTGQRVIWRTADQAMAAMAARLNRAARICPGGDLIIARPALRPFPGMFRPRG